MFIKDMNNILINEKNEKNNDLEINKNKIRKYFQDIDLTNLREINNKKLEILFKMKHDMEYKIRKGDIKPAEKDEYKKLEEKINNLTNSSLDNLSISEYIDELEEYFYSFENNLYNAEQKKKDEERINGFKGDLQKNINFYYIIKKKIEEKYGYPIDFKNINHLNELSNI